MVQDSKWGKVSDIEPKQSETWQGKTFLTLDADWACDEILSDTYKLISDSSIESTWFLTNETQIQENLALDTKVEIGIHPNFNYLVNPLEHRQSNSSREAVAAVLRIFPNATALRSHSLFQSERLIDEFLELGITHTCNSFISSGSGIKIKPWNLWGGAICVPHSWQDNVSLRMHLPLPEIPSPKEVRVLNFHPIHIFLNTDELSTYESTRPIHQNPKALIRHRKPGLGIRDLFIKVLSEEC